MFPLRFRTVFLSGISMVLALCLSQIPAGAANLLANPGFETDGGSYTGWFTFGGPQISTPATDNIARSGTAAAKLFGQFSGCPGTPAFSVAGFGQAFTSFNFAAGKEYVFSGTSFVSSADPIPGTDICSKNRAIAKLVFFNAVSGGSELQSNEVVIASGQSPVNEWVPFSIASTAPAAARRVEVLFLFLQPACDPGAVFIDDAHFQELNPVLQTNALANPGFVSGLTGWTTFGNVFAETRAAALHTRAGAAKLFSTFTPDSPSGMFQTVAAFPGSQWELGTWSLNTCFFQPGEMPVTGSNDNILVAKLVFKDNNGLPLVGGSEVVIANASSPLGTWKQDKLIAVAPSGTVLVEAFILFVSPSLLGGNFFVDDISLRRLDVLDVPAPTSGVFEVRAIAPNPAQGPMRIDYALPRSGKAEVVVYDITGRFVQTVFNGDAEAGLHTAIWDGRSANGRLVPAGVYRCIVRSGGEQRSRAMIVTR